MLHILNKHLANERLWLMREGLGKADARYREGARMAKERIPQLEAAIKMLTQDTSSKTQDKKPKKSNVLCLDTNVKTGNRKQLNLFNQ